ncbi:MAG: type II toxin-antitoxin system PemK/MazF family toxin [Prosthecobacter sp.]|nr:type II toxin-antitoxin system PemK/MazF family toxin [Prosthecobacter sp.]
MPLSANSRAMKQWDILLFPFAAEGSHPAVILSNDEHCSNPAFLYVNALLCTSIRVPRPAKRNEVILNGADGLDWLTAVRCDAIHMLRKDQFVTQRGTVSRERRRAIGRKLIECFRLLDS